MWRVLLLHLAHQVADRLGLRHQADGAHQFAHGAVLALLFLQFEHVAHVDEADHLVDVLLVDRDARVLLGDDQLAQLLERGVGGDGDDVGPRRHHFAHHLVAELDHGLDQLAVFLFDQALFGAGGDQGFDVLGGRGLFGRRRLRRR